MVVCFSTSLHQVAEPSFKFTSLEYQWDMKIKFMKTNSGILKLTHSLKCNLILFLFIGSFGGMIIPSQVLGQIVYSGLIGGIDRGDSASLPTLGFKLGPGTEDGLELTYARGGIKSKEEASISYSETEQLFAVGYHAVSEGTLGDMIIGGGLGAVNSTSSVEGQTESVTNLAILINTGINWEVVNGLGFKIGLDVFLIPVPAINPLYAIGVRNFWFLGIDIGF